MKRPDLDERSGLPNPRSVGLFRLVKFQQRNILRRWRCFNRPQIRVDVGELLVGQKLLAISRHVEAWRAHLKRESRVRKHSRRDFWAGATVGSLTNRAVTRIA